MYSIFKGTRSIKQLTPEEINNVHKFYYKYIEHLYNKYKDRYDHKDRKLIIIFNYCFF